MSALLLDVSESQEPYPSASQASNTSDGYLTLKANNTGAGVLNTPLAAVTITETSGQTYGIAEKDTERYKRLQQESLRWLVGTMPVLAFLYTFLGEDRVDMTRMPGGRGMFTDYLEKGKQWPRTEKAIQTAIISAMHEVFDLEDGTATTRCPGFTFCDTSGYPDQLTSGGKIGAVKPDICLYANDHLPQIKNAVKKPEDKYSDMGFSALHFEVKSSISGDFFQDITPKMLEGTRDAFTWIVDRGDENVSVTQVNHARHNLGQTVAYATEGCKRQHRRHYFTVSVSGPRIRFIRWDRAGAVVSEGFNVLDHPGLFCQFFWRFAHITDAERGYDLTVEPATETQEEIFRQAIEQHVMTQSEGNPETSDAEEVKTALEEHYQQNAVTVIHLPHSPHFNDPDLQGHHLLVSRPLAVPLSIAGRSTRTYWAVDSRTGKVVLLKDTWRYDTIRVDPLSGVQRAEREGDILEAMKDSVANIPKVVHQEDVPDFAIDASWVIQYDKDHAQTTQTQHFVDADWACGADRRRHVIVKRIHYRLVLDVAGYTLLRLQGTSELLHGARDALKALQDAFLKWGRFHGDITPGHIILYKTPGKPERKGYLVDWDLSRAIGDGDGYLQDFQVSSTWQFLSAKACSHNWADEPFRIHTIQDDMESILYVVLYCGVMYLPHQTDPADFRELLKGMFDFYAMSEGGIPHGGDGKRRNQLNRSFTCMFGWNSPPFKEWLDTIMNFHQRGTGWNPAAVGDWWDAFLVQHGQTLPRADRQNNIKLTGQKVARSDWEAPYHVTGKPQQSTRTSPLSLPVQLNPSVQKRNVDEAGISDAGDDGTSLPQKRMRTVTYETWSPGSEPFASGSGLSAWRGGLTLSALSTPTVREGSYDSGAGTDGEYSTNMSYEDFRGTDLAMILRQLAAQRSEEDETEEDEDVKGKGRAVTRGEE